MKFLSPFRNEVSQSRQAIEAGDTVMDVVIEADTQLSCGLRQRHKGIPRCGALAGARPKAHIPWSRARAPSSAELLCRGISGCERTINKLPFLVRVRAIRSSSAS